MRDEKHYHKVASLSILSERLVEWRFNKPGGVHIVEVCDFSDEYYGKGMARDPDEPLNPISKNNDIQGEFFRRQQVLKREKYAAEKSA